MFFFFFQAEDGIRDYKVTGVQTCALPIFEHRALVIGGRIQPSDRGVAALIVHDFPDPAALAIGRRLGRERFCLVGLAHGLWYWRDWRLLNFPWCKIGRASCRERV